MVAAFVHDSAAIRVVFAEGALAEVGIEAVRLGAQRILLIAGAAEAGYARDIADQLGEHLVARIDEVVMHVPRAAAERAVAAARDCGADLVLSVGGGSATGLAKAVALATGLPVLAVPTTYAGSEMTDIWGVTDGGRKTTGRDPRVRPRTVVYDPGLTLSLPVHVATASGMNALAHLVEGRYAPDASPLTHLQADEGLRSLADALPRLAADPSSLQARGDALYGAWLAGWTLGATTMGLHHKICHVLGGMFDLPHAPMHSATLPYVTAFNAPAAPAAMAAVAAALGAGQPAAPALWDLAERIGAATSLAAVGLPLAGIEPAVEAILASPPQNPRPIEREGLRALLQAAYDGIRPPTAL